MNSDQDFLKAIQQAENSNPADEQAINGADRENWEQNLLRKSNGDITQKQHNYLKILEHDENLADKFRFDAYKHTVMVQGNLPFGSFDEPEPLTEVMFTRILEYVGAKYGNEDEKKIRRAIEAVAMSNSFDSLISMLDGLEWDGTPRIETMLSKVLGAEDSDYTREVSKLLMKGAVCRAYEPGVQFDYMPILIGEQGCRKTSFCRRLALLPDYFEGCLGDLSNRETMRMIQGVLVVEMAELAAFESTRRQETIRGFITRTHDSIRPLYADNIERYPRRCVFIGTTNNWSCLTDPAGDRRYLPVEVGLYRPELDWNNEESVHGFFRQIWAEAICWYKSNPKKMVSELVLPDSVMEEVQKQRNRFKEEDPWLHQIRGYLSENEDREICAMEILANALGWELTGQDAPTQKAIRAGAKQVHELMRYGCLDWERVNGQKRLGTWGPQSVYYVKKQG